MHFHNTAAEETEQYENQQDNISIARTTVESSRLALSKYKIHTVYFESMIYLYASSGPVLESIVLYVQSIVSCIDVCTKEGFIR